MAARAHSSAVSSPSSDAATLTANTLCAPASSSARAQTLTVAPVVITSSTSNSRFPSMRAASRTANAPSRFTRRCSALRPAWLGVRRHLYRLPHSTGSPSSGESRFASRVGRLYHCPAYEGGPGTMQSYSSRRSGPVRARSSGIIPLCAAKVHPYSSLASSSASGRVYPGLAPYFMA